MTSTITQRVGHLIGGEMTAAENARAVHDPGKLDEVVAEVAVGTVDDVDRAVRCAHEAFQSWRQVPVAERVQKLLAAADVLTGSADELASLLVREHGGVAWEAHTDFALGTGVLQHTASLTEEFFTPVQFDDAESFISVEKVPRGVAAAIVPWNMPVVLTMMKLAPALATGNTMVLKPSPFAPAALTLALSRMAELLPPGVLNVVHGEGDVGAALCSHPLVRKVGFTGGTETAQKVIGATSETIKNVTLELGGNDPAIVLDDVDIDAALDRMLKGVYTRSGQICFAVKRIYVPRGLYQRFADAFCDRVDEYAVGHGLDSNAGFGPLNNETQYKKVLDLLDRTRNSAANLVQLGRKLDPAGWDNGYYVLPHVVRDTEHSTPISCQEQFGPVVPLIAYDDEQQVLEWANDSEYGLGSSVWTSNPDRGLDVARRIEAGSTFINTHAFESLDLRMPFGGIKQSGIGREFGTDGLAAYVEDHSIRRLK
ncbi:acyl-CoA reductase-like NAD-dependent aldehyde dehydrogenase [Saccharopolyspora lacisalsi]|uniref:Acyl-CoA reductase-like NAD-dependent aldehyde dehydrogenase n=1 Tax=Halosaccharopolyspora lacisalsi TaxID=1000566 RepID=A0A839DSM2_9PSEU|nr:aldehyde dehydrogenase family protein [Halosaccharopolyspora lacisalsi]MBA8824073.1 acyl-CoA reductase-like NAD-dependent aldehyde dehydrogenase [Halosaccharopolyspora lacisalsi]